MIMTRIKALEETPEKTNDSKKPSDELNVKPAGSSMESGIICFDETGWPENWSDGYDDMYPSC